MTHQHVIISLASCNSHHERNLCKVVWDYWNYMRKKSDYKKHTTVELWQHHFMSGQWDGLSGHTHAHEMNIFYLGGKVRTGKLHLWEKEVSPILVRIETIAKCNYSNSTLWLKTTTGVVLCKLRCVGRVGKKSSNNNRMAKNWSTSWYMYMYMYRRAPNVNVHVNHKTYITSAHVILQSALQEDGLWTMEQRWAGAPLKLNMDNVMCLEEWAEHSISL